MSLFENAISLVSPSLALERAKNRVKLQSLKRAFEGAAKGRRTDGWRTNNSSDNLDILSALPTLRSRSKDLSKNNPYAKNAVKRISHNTTGTGIIPAITGKNETEVERLKVAWNGWADKLDCDFDERLSFYGIQNIVMRTIAKSGECIVRRVKTERKGNQIPLELQVLDPEFLDTTKDTQMLTDGGYIMGGVEFNEKGKKVAYHIYDRHPNETLTKSTRIPKEDIIHVFEVEDPGQVRGIPFVGSSVLRLRDFDEYEDAQLVKQKIAACFSVFVTELDAGNNTDVKEDYEESERVEPGIIQHLPPGKSVEFAAPPAAEGFSDYSKQVLRGISAGYGITYEAMTNDLSGVNFSSGRMGWLEFQRNVEAWQWLMLIPQLCDRVWEWFVEAATILGLAKEGSDIRVTWTAPRREMIDPVKETKGLLAQVKAGFISWQEAVRSMGFTPEEILEEIKQARAMTEGLDLSWNEIPEDPPDKEEDV